MKLQNEIRAAGVTGSMLGRNPIGRGSNPRQPNECRSTRRGLAFYLRRYAEWREKMGAGGSERARADARIPEPVQSCPRLRYLAERWREKAQAARRAYERWHRYHYSWTEWLPAKWVRIAHCETGIRWNWNSGTYEGAFGFYFGTWDAYKPRGAPRAAYLATPREQYQCALNVFAAHGYGAWGCGGA